MRRARVVRHVRRRGYICRPKHFARAAGAGAGIHAVLADDDGPAAVPETGAIADIKLNYRTVILAPEKKFTLSASGASDADAIVWTSSDESVVRVEDGVVTAVGPGLARVYAIDVNGQKRLLRV